MKTQATERTGNEDWKRTCRDNVGKSTSKNENLEITSFGKST